MMIITATEYKLNLGKYLDYQGEDDFLITKNGKICKILSNPKNNKKELLERFSKIASTKKI